MYTRIELDSAVFQITSSLHKSEKAILKLKEESWQFKLLKQGIISYSLALELLSGRIDSNNYSTETLQQSIDFFLDAISRVEKVLPKFNEGTPQHTLAIRRIKAFEIAIDLLQQKKSE